MFLVSKIRSLVLLSALAILAACGSTTVSDDSTARMSGDYSTNMKGFEPVVYFDFDKSAIKTSEVGKIASQAEKVKKDKPASVVVEGHTDAIGTKEYNIALGERRANSTKNALVKAGIPNRAIRVVSYGKESPADTSGTTEGDANNRRTVTVLK